MARAFQGWDLQVQMTGQHFRQVIYLCQWAAFRGAIRSDPLFLVAANFTSPGFLIQEKYPAFADHHKVYLVGASIAGWQRLITDDKPRVGQLLQLLGCSSLSFSDK